MAYAASDLEARAFTANLHAGHPAAQDHNQGHSSPSTFASGLPTGLRLETPRSAGFRFDPHSRDGTTLTLAYLPAAFALQPAAAEPAAIRFLFMPPTGDAGRSQHRARKTLSAFLVHHQEIRRCEDATTAQGLRSFPLAQDSQAPS